MWKDVLPVVCGLKRVGGIRLWSFVDIWLSMNWGVLQKFQVPKLY